MKETPTPRRAAACLGPVLGGGALAAVLTTAMPIAAEVATVRLSPAGSVLRADIAPGHGADLAGLELNLGVEWVQLLYRGNDYAPTNDWTGKAPILWPATGRNFSDPGGTPTGDSLGWTVDGVRYPMPIHGFARDRAWTLAQLDGGGERARAVLTLDDDEESRRHYPFGFHLTVEYALSGHVLTIRKTVRASPANTGPMPFSIGNHVTFNLPLVPGGKADAVRVETPARKHLLIDGAGRPTGQFRPAGLGTPTPVSELPTRVAVSLGDYPPPDPWLRLADPAGVTVTVTHSASRPATGEPVLFNLWGDVGHGFFSPEPWVGKQNSLVTGDGVVTLSPGEVFVWVISIAVALEG